MVSIFAAGQSTGDSAAITRQLQVSKQLYTEGKVDSAIDVALAAAKQARQAGNLKSAGTAHIYIGNFHYVSGRLDSALAHYSITARLSEARPVNKFTSLMNKGIIYDYLGEIDSSLFYYNQSIEFADEANLPNLKASALLNFGSFYDDRGNYQMALDYYNRALRLLEEYGPADKLNAAKMNIGGIYEQLDRTAEAVKMYKELLATVDNDSKIVLANTYLQLAQSYLTLDSLQAANDATGQLFEILESFKNAPLEIDALFTKGRIQMKRERYENAIPYFQDAHDLAENAGFQTRIVSTGHALAKCHFELGNLQPAEDYAQNALQFALENEEFDMATKITRLLSEIHQSLGNISTANGYLNQYIRYEDSLNAQNSRKEVNRLLLEHREFEYQLLKKEQELQDLELINQEAKLTRNRIFLGATAVIALILLFLLSWLYRTSKKEKRLTKLLEENNNKIEEQNKMLRALNTDKDRLLHVVAHDLRNPMNAINGFIQLFEEEDNLSADQRENIAMIKKSIEHGTGIIDELLNLETEQPTKLNKTEFDLTELVEDVVREFEGAAKEKFIELRFSPEGNIAVFSDVGKIKRLTENLLSNAIKFSPQDETVIIKLQELDENVKLTVKDNGPGFSEQDKKLLFKKFQKLSAKPTGGEASTGIGLAIVQDFVSLMDGNISVESEQGNGAAMIVTLPKNIAQSEPFLSFEDQEHRSNN